MSGALLVFAKLPRAGHVKTRLCPPFTPEQAAAFYAALLDDVLEASAQAAAELGLQPLLAVHPPGALAELARRAPAAFEGLPQRGAALAERIENALAEASSGGHAPLLLRGSDSPTLDRSVFEAALAALAHADLVLCPDRDGGYSLVGLRRPVPGLFAHPMSTASVLEDTLANARRLGLRSALLPARFDVDTAADLALLAQARAGAAPPPCPRTFGFLDLHRLW